MASGKNGFAAALHQEFFLKCIGKNSSVELERGSPDDASPRCR
jgi:hypothetical protein